MTPDELKDILKQHLLWLNDESTGKYADLSGANLSGAVLNGANLCRAVLNNTNLSSTNLSHADLSYADIRRANISNADLRHADLRHADLNNADLSNSVLNGANLNRATLSGVNLHNTKLNYTVPTVPRLHQQILKVIEGGGKLEMDAYHRCETTHCRAGWAIQLAGDAGWKLEKAVGSSVAGALITIASCPYLNGKVPDFYASNEVAMKEIIEAAKHE